MSVSVSPSHVSVDLRLASEALPAPEGDPGALQRVQFRLTSAANRAERTRLVSEGAEAGVVWEGWSRTTWNANASGLQRDITQANDVLHDISDTTRRYRDSLVSTRERVETWQADWTSAVSEYRRRIASIDDDFPAQEHADIRSHYERQLIEIQADLRRSHTTATGELTEFADRFADKLHEASDNFVPPSARNSRTDAALSVLGEYVYASADVRQEAAAQEAVADILDLLPDDRAHGLLGADGLEELEDFFEEWGDDPYAMSRLYEQLGADGTVFLMDQAERYLGQQIDEIPDERTRNIIESLKSGLEVASHDESGHFDSEGFAEELVELATTDDVHSREGANLLLCLSRNQAVIRSHV